MQVAQEALAAHRTVQLFNAIPHEEKKFSDRVDHVLKLVRHEAVASGFIFGSNGWIGNVALSALLSYGTCFSSFSTRKGHYTEWIGGSLVGHRQISVEKLTSHLMYTIYVGSGLQMLTYGPSASLGPAPLSHPST
jgi:ABC-type multidrug transport system fused ATPase/permease subunit